MQTLTVSFYIGTYRHWMHYCFVQCLCFGDLPKWRRTRICGCPSWGCRCHVRCSSMLTRQPDMPQPLYCPMQSLQSKSLSIKKQNRIIVLVVFTAPLKGNIWLSRLIIMELDSDPIFLVLIQWSRLALVNWCWLKFI